MTCKNLGPALAVIGGCAPKPLHRDIVLVERVSSNVARPGGVVPIDFAAIPAQDSLGRHAHVRKILILGAVSLNITAGTNDAVSAYQMRSLVSQIFLEDESGHQYYAGLDGRSLVDDAFFRNGFRLPYAMGGALAANVGAGARSQPFDCIAHLASDHEDADPADGLIPLATLQKRGKQAFRFRLGSVIAGSTAPANVTVTGYTCVDGSAGIDVWAEIVYLNDLIVDEPWALREYRKAEKNGVFDAPEAKHSYLTLRNFPEDAALNAGQNDVTNLTGVTVQVGGMPVLSGALQADWTRRDAAIVSLKPRSAASLSGFTGVTGIDLPAEANVTRSFGMLLPPMPREIAPAGAVSYRYATAPSTAYRYLHRFTYCDSVDRVVKIKTAAAGDEPLEVVPLPGGAKRLMRTQ